MKDSSLVGGVSADLDSDLFQLYQQYPRQVKEVGQLACNEVLLPTAIYMGVRTAIHPLRITEKKCHAQYPLREVTKKIYSRRGWGGFYEGALKGAGRSGLATVMLTLCPYMEDGAKELGAGKASAVALTTFCGAVARAGVFRKSADSEVSLLHGENRGMLLGAMRRYYFWAFLPKNIYVTATTMGILHFNEHMRENGDSLLQRSLVCGAVSFGCVSAFSGHLNDMESTLLKQAPMAIKSAEGKTGAATVWSVLKDYPKSALKHNESASTPRGKAVSALLTLVRLCILGYASDIRAEKEEVDTRLDNLYDARAIYSSSQKDK